MNVESLVQLIDITQRSLELNLEGFTHEESLLQPPAGNCVNWQLGHILLSRNQMLSALGATPAWDPPGAALYRRGSEPIAGDREGVVPFEELLGALRTTNRLLVETVRAAGEEGLAENVKGSPAERVDFLIFHEAYHAGQVGLMRRIVGKERAIR